MDLECFKRTLFMYGRRDARLVSIAAMSYRIHLVYFVLIPLLIVLWIYIVLTAKSSLTSKASIEVNVIGPKNNDKNHSESVKKVKYHVPKFMLELYEKNKSAPKKDADADLVRSLIPTQAEKLEENDVFEELSENHLLIFNIPSSETDEIFIGAELRILTRIEIHSKDEIGVKKALKVSIFNENTKTFSNHRELEIHHFNDTWLTFNLTNEVKNVLILEQKILKVIVTVSAIYHHHTKNNLKLSIMPRIENFDHDHDYPILVLLYSIEDDRKASRQVRNKRNVEEDYEEDSNSIWSGDNGKKHFKKFKRNNCKRRNLYVNFADIKYDLWIVQPAGYDAYQCQGKCFYPVAEHLSPTKHAIMQTLIHSVDPSKASRSCCVPTILDSISILYVDDKGVLTYRYAYKDMVVLECGCR